YLKAEWEHSFGAEPAEENAPFTRADGSTVRTKLMRLRADLRYATAAGWQAIELPYAKSELALWVLLPARGSAPAGLLTPDTLGRVATGLRPADIGLLMPGWDFGVGLDLKPPLRALGLNALFDGADFSGIAPGVSVGQVIHHATITVDEWGTEAAAV